MIIALSILKVLGILLLILVCILVLILFVPVIYEVDADIDHKRFEANVKWLFRLVRFRFTYREKMEAVLSVLFLQFDFLDPEKKKERERKKQKRVSKKAKKAFRKREKEAAKRRKKTEKNKKAYYKNKENTVESIQTSAADADSENAPVQPQVQDSVGAQTDAVKTGKRSDTIQKAKDTTGKVTGTAKKVKRILGLISEYDVIGIAGPKLLAFLRHIRPRVLRGEVDFGLEDPAATGYITGGVAAIPFLYEFDLAIVPDFETDENYISGTVYSRGHLLLVHVVILVIRLIKEKNIRKFIGALRKTLKKNH